MDESFDRYMDQLLRSWFKDCQENNCELSFEDWLEAPEEERA